MIIRNYKKANLGMSFENKINLANLHYLDHDIAVIYKKPTPITIVKVMYPRRSRAKIIEAYFKVPSTTDYNGIYKVKYIDFEAKTTKAKSFSFDRIYKHQVFHLESVKEHGGLSFILVEFSTLNETYLLPIEVFLKYFYDTSINKRKSIPYQVFKDEAYLVENSDYVDLDYLKIIDDIYFKR